MSGPKYYVTAALYYCKGLCNIGRVICKAKRLRSSLSLANKQGPLGRKAQALVLILNGPLGRKAQGLVLSNNTKGPWPLVLGNRAVRPCVIYNRAVRPVVINPGPIGPGIIITSWADRPSIIKQGP